MFKGLGNLASMMKQAQEMQGKMGEIQENLGHLRETGTAGGGMVRVDVSGLQQVVGCTIDEKLIEAGDREMLEDLIVAATNQALEKAKALAADQLREAAGGFDVPGLGDALSKMGLDGTTPG
jgi:nucleoid-associated protein EbfC